jgi:glycosyltransferase involved in cell wall biosynthesis
MAALSQTLRVERSLALDAARHLSIGGRYPHVLANPDRWSSWILFGTRRGQRLISELRPDAIWATYPIPSALVLGRRLARTAGLPWVADLRDAVVDDDFPSEDWQRDIHRRVEEETVRSATRVVVTTPAAERMYRARYSSEISEKWACIRNGYSEADFARAAAMTSNRASRPDRKITLLHSGLLNVEDRDPRPFLDALGFLKAGGFDVSQLRVVFRAPGNERWLADQASDRGLQDIVAIAPGIPYLDALREMLDADGLLIFQGPTCDHLIPAKLYEYMRCERPIFAVTTTSGETGQLLHTERAGRIADPASPDLIADSLTHFVAELQTGTAHIASRAASEKYSRHSQARELAALLDSITS